MPTCLKDNRRARQEDIFLLEGMWITNNNYVTHGAVLIINTILIHHVMSSAAEADIGAVFLNAK
jgi:hypothetical protein